MNEEEILSKLEELDIIKVFERINTRLPAERELLWKKIQNEIKSGGVRSAVNWLECALKQRSEQVRKKLNQFREMEE